MTDTKTPSPSPSPSDAELVPCPFCGSKEVNVADDLITFYGECGACGATAAYSSYRTGAVQAWNRRAPQPAPVREPLTQVAILNAYCATPGIHQFIEAFVAGARFAERAHGIAACSGKENSNAD